MVKIAVISFPGTNCETETIRAFKRNGIDAEMVLWNDPKILDSSKTSEFDGYCIAGGFSYEDRGRSGIVAAQEPITEILKKEADEGKVILGICNGAQILVETGLIPGFDNKSLAIALTWNEMKKDDKLIDTGFYNSWVYLKNVAPIGRSAFNGRDAVIHIPMAHGEGRFLIKDEVLKKLKENNQIIYKYANKQGEVDPNFPNTPNGATESIAALCNPAGNVMAIMPHPERDPRGNGNEIFQSIKKHIESGKVAKKHSIGTFTTADDIREPDIYDLEIFVRLIITDNAERTIEMAINKQGFNVSLERYKYYGIKLSNGSDPKKAVEDFMKEGELANLNKEIVYARIGGRVYRYNKDGELEEKDLELNHYVVVRDEQDFIGEAKKDALNHYAGDVVKKANYGVLWNFKNADSATIEKVIKTNVLYNPNSMYVTVK